MAQDPTKYADMEKALAAFKEIGTVALSGEGELLGVAVFKHLRLGIHPREVVDEPRLAHMAGLAGILVETASHQDQPATRREIPPLRRAARGCRLRGAACPSGRCTQGHREYLP